MVLVGLFGAGCAEPSVQEEDAEGSSAIIGGEESDAVPAIGYIANAGTNVGGTFFVDPFCTGTLIAPNVVLTAAHCADAAEQQSSAIHFGIGDPRDKRVVSVTQPPVLHPAYDAEDGVRDYSHDMAYLILDTPITDVAPATIRRTSHAGHCDYVSTGYGVSRAGFVHGSKAAPSDSGKRASTATCGDAGYTTGKRLLAEDDISLPGGMIRTYSNGVGAPCVGDSGGPLRIRNTREIVGVLSQIAERVCTTDNVAFYAPIEPSLGFIDEALAAGRRLD
jgi:secreted trypsin-like serine protease